MSMLPPMCLRAKNPVSGDVPMRVAQSTPRNSEQEFADDRGAVPTDKRQPALVL
eukprot:CAMPEP_0179919028 /NCGR_PEP_ID=MMETSP0983-20121128/3697_1 /TAXON_ID=483367 /ORGANISM="non described non described, Strain CCMP 2436" /LENGTH=53 /DNA_ID=CAMNT_0021821901 /DNA_START=183 /DNA_END=343 /DNA_ORIENTATION=-